MTREETLEQRIEAIEKRHQQIKDVLINQIADLVEFERKSMNLNWAYAVWLIGMVMVVITVEIWKVLT